MVGDGCCVTMVGLWLKTSFRLTSPTTRNSICPTPPCDCFGPSAASISVSARPYSAPACEARGSGGARRERGSETTQGTAGVGQRRQTCLARRAVGRRIDTHIRAAAMQHAARARLTRQHTSVRRRRRPRGILRRRRRDLGHDGEGLLEVDHLAVQSLVADDEVHRLAPRCQTPA